MRYRDNIFHKLEVIQATTLLVKPGYEVGDVHGVQRLGRRFFTTRCVIAKIPPLQDQIASAVEGRPNEGGGYGAANYDTDARVS